MDPRNSGTKSITAPENLFKVDEDCEKLSPDKAKGFHNMVAKTLYTTKRARPDTCTSVAFLTNRVRKPNTDDWKNLAHLMNYLRKTRNLQLILGAGSTGILRVHNGGGLSTGRGFLIVTYTKQNINTRISTEAEIVGVDDCILEVCWIHYFLETHNYNVTLIYFFPGQPKRHTA